MWTAEDQAKIDEWASKKLAEWEVSGHRVTKVTGWVTKVKGNRLASKVPD